MVKFLPAPPLGEVTVTSVRCLHRTEDRRQCPAGVLEDFTCTTMAIVYDLPSFVRVLMCHDLGRFVLCFVPHNVSKETTESIELTNLCQPNRPRHQAMFQRLSANYQSCVSSS